ncbi:hypothetical protein [Erythrobacter alti]|uniref:hypothetical protein n=1 Tax=Erythrobacter alti TaxID=1896145 RepID=UPI0030F40852
MKYLLAAISTLALAAVPAMAQGNGNGNGGNNGSGGGQPAHAEHANHSNGGGNAERGNGADRGNGNGNADRGNQANRNNGNGNRDDNVRNENRGNGNVANRNNGNVNRNTVNRNAGNGNRNASRNVDNGNRGGQDLNRGNRGNGQNQDFDRRDGRDGGLIDRIFYRETGLIDGCPPGLAKKRNGCLPPGQARQRDRAYRYGNYSPDWWGLPYGRGDYFYEDGYLLRYSGDRISGYIPLLGGALRIGNPWPSDYGYDRVPDYYTNYYGLGSDYRYADNVVYRLDPETAAITSIAALLTGDEFTVGQPAPRGYDVYNVPYSFRDRYRDGPDAYYRYNDGYVYQIDPETRLVAAAIELLL